PRRARSPSPSLGDGEDLPDPPCERSSWGGGSPAGLTEGQGHPPYPPPPPACGRGARLAKPKARLVAAGWALRGPIRPEPLPPSNPRPLPLPCRLSNPPTGRSMARILVLYYSSYGPGSHMAEAGAA